MEEPPPLPETAPTEPRQPQMSLSARLLNIFAVPGEVFDDIKGVVPSVGNWLATSLLFLVVSWVGVWLIYSQPAVQQQMQEFQDQMIQKMVDKGFIPQEQADKPRDGVGSKIGPYIGPVFVAFISPFFWGFVIWLLGNKVFGGNFVFMKGVEVAGLANAVGVLGSVVKTLLVVGLGDMFASASPTLVVKVDPQEPSFAILAVLDVMTFWLLAVRAIGLARLSGTTFIRAGFWVFGIWLFYTTLLVGGGLAMKKAFGM